MRRIIALLFLVIWTSSAFAQDAGCHADSPPVGWVPRELLLRPLPLRDGVGKAHEQVTTTSKEAQAFYDQGLAYLHSYVYIEAARSFHQALRLDPKLAMAYVGLSRAYSGFFDPDAASAMAQKAVALQDGASDKEKARIELRVLQLAAMKDAEKLPAYKTKLDEALTKWVVDPELWCLRGNVEDRGGASGIGQYGNALSIAMYDRALSIDPDHFGAHHYLIHSYEQFGRMDEALRHGAKYVGYAPAVPHAHHMYGHDLRRVGRTADAIREFDNAYRLELAYYAAEKLEPEMDWHHPHNLDLLATSYQHEGQMRRAEELMKRSRDLRPVTEYQASNKKEWPAFLLSRGRIDEARLAAEEMTKAKYPGARALGHLFAGQALLAKGDVEGADKHLAAGEKEWDAIVGRGRDSVRPYVDKLRGAILIRRGEGEKGRELLKSIQTRLRALPGPDAWSQALFELESIAKLAREAGDWDLAEHTAKQMLDHDPSYGGSHYAMALVARHKADAAVAETHAAKMRALWNTADEDLAEMK